MQALVLLATAYVAGRPDDGPQTVYTIGDPASLFTDLTALPGKLYDLQGLADILDKRIGTQPGPGTLIASYDVKLDSTVTRTHSCEKPECLGTRFELDPTAECYSQDSFPEGCDYKLVQVNKFANFTAMVSTAQDLPCVWGSCLVGRLKDALAAAKDMCASVREGDGFNASECSSCTSTSKQVLEGPWYGNAGTGWQCHPTDPHPMDPKAARWVVTDAYCHCASSS